MKFIKTPVKGMCDMLPADMRLREHVLGMIKESYGAHGFMEIETPVMEHIENLTSKQGGDNEKLIFKVMKRGAELQRAIEKGDGELADNGLRYDLTVPLARYYANNKEKLPTPFKAMQLGNVWRADNPQKGRFRQFTQCDIDILGDDSSLAEIELITATATMLSKILAEANLNAFTIHINDRRMLAAAALSAQEKQAVRRDMKWHAVFRLAAALMLSVALVYVSRVLDLHGIYGWPQGCTMGMLPFTGWLAGDAVFTLRQVKKL